MTDHVKPRPSQVLEVYRDSIREIALRHRVKNVRVFGSVLHGDDTEDCGLDPTTETTLMDINAIRYELKELLGISVALLTPKALPDHFRNLMLTEAMPI